MNLKRRRYTATEHLTWKLVAANHIYQLNEKACEQYLAGLQRLNLPAEYIPSCKQVNDLLSIHTQWRVKETSTLIEPPELFQMLTHYLFPAITSIRPIDKIDYYDGKAPDVIHEYFGHLPFLTNPEYAALLYKWGTYASQCSLQDQFLLLRLFWFTIEIGLIQTAHGLRVYGAAIISSKYETNRALYDPNIVRKPFCLLDTLRTPISITRMKDIYYVIERFSDLFDIKERDLSEALIQARELGTFKET